MRIGFIEPHLARDGAVRRMVEFANRLTDRGHHVTFYVPRDQSLTCTWLPMRAGVRPLPDGFDDELDVVCFHHEHQWHLLDRFTRARRRVYYVHHGQRRSRDALIAPVDLQLATSNWTADRVEEVTAHRPIVMVGGVNRDTFHPFDLPERHRILCTGDRERPWKGTDTVKDAGRILAIPVAGFGRKELTQAALGRIYASTEVFAVGSWFEGFGQPGLEALACGVPLVTTDNGGCREYAVDGETALLVPPRDAPAMAEALRRVLDDRPLARTLVANGLEVVARDFDWDERTDALAEVLDGIVADPAPVPLGGRPEPHPSPELSIVTLQWNGLGYTQRMVESVRAHTDVPYELIVVDNGSDWEAASYAESAADHVVLNSENRGFSAGMNQGLEMAKGDFVAFCNNDIVVPPGWASRLLETARSRSRAGIVVPAVTSARNLNTVRAEPGTAVDPLPPFSSAPSAVVYVMPTDLIRSLGGWSERYAVASGEDLDLAFSVWVNDLDIVFDSRVLVDHVGKVTASGLDDWRGLWLRNRQLFLDIWGGDGEVPQLDTCDPERFERNRQTARAAAGWMRRFFAERDKRLPMVPTSRARAVAGQVAQRARPAWDVVWPMLPPKVAQSIRRRTKRLGGLH
jgi:GT2 family glycosyltransferase